eukprot:scaffold855_cov344-Prasinococcus_capsulatus_cf.AAC.4
MELGKRKHIFRLIHTDPWIEGDRYKTSRTVSIQKMFADSTLVHAPASPGNNAKADSASASASADGGAAQPSQASDPAAAAAATEPPKEARAASAAATGAVAAASSEGDPAAGGDAGGALASSAGNGGAADASGAAAVATVAGELGAASAAADSAAPVAEQPAGSPTKQAPTSKGFRVRPACACARVAARRCAALANGEGATATWRGTDPTRGSGGGVLTPHPPFLGGDARPKLPKARPHPSLARVRPSTAAVRCDAKRRNAMHCNAMQPPAARCSATPANAAMHHVASPWRYGASARRARRLAGTRRKRAGPRNSEGPCLEDEYGSPLTVSGRAFDDALVLKAEAVHSSDGHAQAVLSSEQSLPLPGMLSFTRLRMQARLPPRELAMLGAPRDDGVVIVVRRCCCCCCGCRCCCWVERRRTARQ